MTPSISRRLFHQPEELPAEFRTAYEVASGLGLAWTGTDPEGPFVIEDPTGKFLIDRKGGAVQIFVPRVSVSARAGAGTSLLDNILTYIRDAHARATAGDRDWEHQAWLSGMQAQLDVTPPRPGPGVFPQTGWLGGDRSG